MATKKEKSGRSLFLDTTSAQAALDKLNAKVAAFDKQLKQTNLTQKEIINLQKSRAEVAKKAADIQEQIEKGIGATLVQQRKYVADLTKEMSLLAVGTQEWTDKGKQIEAASATLIEIKKRQDQVTGAIKETSASTGFWSKNLDNVKSFFVGGGLVVLAQKAFSLIKGFIQDSFSEALEAEENTARLRNALDNLGRTDVFDRMIRKAQEMADKFKFIDNDEITGVFEHLIDFGKLTEKQMNDLLPVIIDFAAKQRISVDEATTSILKFIESGKGMKGFGLNVKEAKSETERLALVMGDLKTKVDGAGEAFEKTTAGGLASAKQEFKNLKEEIGNGLIPVFNFLLARVNDVIDGFKVAGKFAKEFVAGGTGFFQITVDKVKQNESFKEEVKQLAEGFVKSFESVSKSIQDKKLLPDVQKKITDNLKEQIKSAEAQLDTFRKTAKRNDDVAIRELLASIESRKQALDTIEASGNKKTIGNPDKPLTTEDDAKSKFEQLLKEAESFNKKFRDLQQQSEDANKTQNQKEIDDAKHKYAEILIEYNALVKKLGKVGIKLQFDVSDIKNLENQELAGIIQKQLSKAQLEIAQKTVESTKQGFTKQIAETEKFFAEQKQLESQRFVDGIIDKQTYDNNIIALDAKSKEQQLEITQQFLTAIKEEQRKTLVESGDIFSELADQAKADLYAGIITRAEYEKKIIDINAQSKEQQIEIEKVFSATIEQFATNVTNAKKALLDKQVQDEIAVFNKRIENLKLIRDLDNQAALSTLQARVSVARKGSDEELKAKKDLLAFQHKLELEALEQKRIDDLKALEDEFANALRIFNQKLELERKLQLAKVDPNDPKAKEQKTAINKRFDQTKNDAEIESEKNKAVIIAKINDDFNAIIAASNAIFRKNEEDADLQHAINVVNGTLGYLEQVASVFKKFSDAKTIEENRELARIQSGNDKNKASYQKLLNNKLISTQEYHRRIAADEESLEKQRAEFEKKQFERKKKQAIIQALINGALAVTTAISQYAFPLALIPIAFAVAATAAEVISISKQKFEDGGIIPEEEIASVPSREKGGFVTKGPSHKENGIKLVDGRSGKVVGEVEGGEPILSKKTYANNKPVVDELLKSSMYNGGKTIKPFYKNAPYKTIDVMGLSKSIQKVRHYESGGILPSTVNSPQTTEVQPIVMPAMSEKQELLLEKLFDKLSVPLEAVVQYGSIKTAKAKDDKVLEDAIFRKKS